MKESLWNIYCEDSENFLRNLDENTKFDLVVTSPPYNIGKEYEKRKDIQEYLTWQKLIISQIVPKVKETGSICWQVGSYVDKGQILPLDILLHTAFIDLGLQLRNRIVWTYGHGLHAKKRFSGRYEVILWYTKSDDYVFNLDSVRIPSKYPNKKHYKGPNKGKLSGNPLGKNPEDVWDIPNVKHNHPEKTEHPCQFPVALVERLVLSLSNEGDVIFDPFMGSASTGVAAVMNKRYFIGVDNNEKYYTIAEDRLKEQGKCDLCEKLQTTSCPRCNKETNISWQIAVNLGVDDD